MKTMQKYINSSTIANTVRMAIRSRRPRAVFLATDQTEVGLLKTALVEQNCRIIPAHSRENVVHAFEILVRAGWEGVMTVVNTHFVPPTEEDVIRGGIETDEEVSIEGAWEDVQQRGELLAGRQVRVTIFRASSRPNSLRTTPNARMLRALNETESILANMNSRRDEIDHLREAREGGMYGFGAE